MYRVLSKIFIRRFYAANAGFFLFFFFVLFGAVDGSSLMSYHLSLMKSILGSATILWLVCFIWLLYHLKCTTFFLQIIDSEEGAFLYNLQALFPGRQWLLYMMLYGAVYAPVLVYAVLVFVVGVQQGYRSSAAGLLFFQLLSFPFFTGLIYYRINNRLRRFALPSFRLPFYRPLWLTVFYYFTIKKKVLLLTLKAFSLFLLYIILIWNRGRYDNDSFLLFYLIILAANAAIPYLSVQFMEQQFAAYRNLPVSLFRRGIIFLLSYTLLAVPEAVYLLYFGEALPLAVRIGYVVILVTNPCLLTAFLYSEAQSREEYLKATFTLVFISIFVFHVQAFWLWIVVQLIISTVLFATGYHQYQTGEK